MALSLGDAVLAFAGGAATQANKIMDEERENQTAMQRRAQELQDAAAAKQAETQWSKELDRHHKTESLYESLKAIPGGANSPMGQILIAQHGGMDLAQVVKTGMYGRLTAPERSDAPIPLTDRLAQYSGSKYPEEKLGFAKRVRETFTGKKYTKDGRAIPRGVIPKDDGSISPEDVIVSAGGSLTDPGVLVQDLSVLEGHQTMMDAIGRSLIGEKPDVKFHTVEGVGLVATTLDSKGNVVAETVIESEKKPELTESRQLFRSLETNEIIRPTFNKDGTYTHGGETIDITKFEPVTEDTATARSGRLVERVEKMKTRQVALGNFQAGLDNYKRVVTAATTGATGVVLDVGSAIGTTIRGVGELLGVDPTTPAEREALLEKANIDIDEFIGGDKTALRGMVAQDAKQLVYTLAGILKEDADLGRTTVADVENAAKMIRDLSDADRGIGAIRSLQSIVNTKKAGLFQEMYQSEGVNAKDKATAGINLLRISLAPDKKDWEKIKNNVRVNQTTGEVVIRYPDGFRTLDQVIAIEGRDGNLRPQRQVFAQ